ncbi:MAG: acetyltransferase [Bryobacteraceae bacterium]
MNPRVVLLGSGGHAKVIIGMLEERAEFEIIGCTGGTGDRKDVLGYAILGDDSILNATLQSGTRHTFAAVGDNLLRSKLLRNVEMLGFEVITVVSTHAIVAPRAIVERGAAVMPGAIVGVDAKVGYGAIVNTGSVVDHDCSIGRYAHVCPGSSLAGGVQVGEGAFLGTGCKVIPGIKIGAWSTIGAGAVVIRDIPANVTAMGVPAVVRSAGA